MNSSLEKWIANNLSFALICIGVGAAISILFSAGLFSNIDLALSDNLYGGKNALDNIVIVSIDDASIQSVGRWPWDRSVIASLIDNLNGSKIIAVDIGFFEESRPGQDQALAESIRRSGNVILAIEQMQPDNKFLEPIGILKNASLDLGYINVATDRDGVTRSINPYLSIHYDPISAVIYRHIWGAPKKYVTDRFLIDFIGPAQSFRYISAQDVLNQKIKPEELQGKFVFIGATAPDLHDDFLVPTSKHIRMPGVEIHAHALQSLINNADLRKVPSWIISFIIVAFAVAVGFIARKTSYTISITLSAAIILLYLFAVIKAYDSGFIMNIIYPPLTAVIAYMTSIGYSYLVETREKKKVLAAFGKYVSPVLVKEIMDHPEKLKLGGEKREITVLFSDVRGFTSISEKLSPEELVALLNDFLSEMTDIILDNRGLVDKYMGDAIMALWNAPLDDSAHAKNACTASLKMVKRLKEFQKNWKRTDIPALNIGIGLNTGPAVVGNMGSRDRFDYTAMGDTVNLGSRLEGLTKQYSINTIVSQSTYELVKDEFLCKKLDKVAVKGKKEGIVIYELICRHDEASDAQKEQVLMFEEALTLYFEKNFRHALLKFRSLEEGGEPSAKEFVHRCGVFITEPPLPDWDGVWVMKTK